MPKTTGTTNVCQKEKKNVQTKLVSYKRIKCMLSIFFRKRTQTLILLCWLEKAMFNGHEAILFPLFNNVWMAVAFIHLPFILRFFTTCQNLWCVISHCTCTCPQFVLHFSTSAFKANTTHISFIHHTIWFELLNQSY